MKTFFFFTLVSSFCFTQQKTIEIPTKNLIDSIKRFSWNEEIKIWEIKELITNNYDQDLNKNGEIRYKYNKKTSSYQAIQKKELFYTNNLISRSVVMLYDEKSKTWMKNEYTDFTYNSANKEEKANIFKYDKQLKSWYQKSKTEFFYSSSSLKDSALNFSYNKKEEKWDLIDKILYNYDQNNKYKNQIRYLYNIKTKSWEQFSNTLQKNNVQINQYWVDSSSIWCEKSKNTSTYFADKNITERVYYTWNNEMKLWENTTKIEYYYTRKNIIPNEEVKSKITVYPNPTFGKIMFDNLNKNSSIKIFNLKGEQVLVFENLHNMSEIDLSSYLESGVYFIETIQDDKLERLKFILL